METVSVAGVDETVKGDSSIIHLPSLPVVVLFDCPANCTVTGSPGLAFRDGKLSQGCQGQAEYEQSTEQASHNKQLGQ